MSKKWNFKAPLSRGIAPRQAHADVPEGLWERELARNAFFGASTHFYHRNPPTGWNSTDEQGPHRHRFDTRNDILKSTSPWDARELASNASVRIRFWKTSGDMDHLVRNADGDELLFIHAGTCELFCDFGHITLAKGDYFILPRGTLWRIEVQASVEVLLIESTDAARAKAFAQALFRVYFIDDRDISDPETSVAVAATLGFAADTVRAALADEAVKNRTREIVDAAVAKGAFGSPFFFVDGEPFWGSDRLDQIERWIATGGW